MASKAKGRKGKLGKNKSRIVVYYAERHAFNKARGILHHIRRGGNDSAARAQIEVLLAAMPLNMSRKFRAMYGV